MKNGRHWLYDDETHRHIHSMDSFWLYDDETHQQIHSMDSFWLYDDETHRQIHSMDSFWLSEAGPVYRMSTVAEAVFQSGSRSGRRVFSMEHCCPPPVSRFRPLCPPSIAADDHFRYAAATVENAWNRLVEQ